MTGKKSDSGEPDGFTDGAEFGVTGIVDSRFREFLESELPAPAELDLDLLFESACSVQLLEDGVLRGEPMGHRVILKSADPNAVARFRTLLRFNESGFHCMCHGDMALVFHDAAGNRLAVLGLHHGVSYRWDNVWASDAALANPGALAEYLADLGAPQMLEQQRQARARAEEQRRVLQTWQRAAPTGCPHMSEVVDEFGSLTESGRTSLIRALDINYSTQGDAIRALLHWFGSGQGPWSGYPSYEEVADKLLRTYDVESLVVAVSAVELTPTQLEGAARLFAGWKFWDGRKSEAQLVPEELRERLRLHVKMGSDPDKISRFKKAFKR